MSEVEGEASMTSWNEEERSLRAYLLGETAPEEQRQIEERLLLDGDYVELLLITEEELIDSYVRDTLSERERQQFQKHVLTTPERWRKLRKAKALRRYINNAQTIPAPASVRELRSKVFWKPSLLTPAWRSAIAAMLILGLAIGVWRVFIHQSLTDKGRHALQAALRESPTEARIAGFKWAPQSNTLGSQPNEIADKTSLDRAFSYFRDALDEQPGPDSQYALGQFYLAKGELDSAIKYFEQALESMPKNAKLHSDLGAALLEMARRETAKGDQKSDLGNRSDYLPQSLDHLNRALELDDSLLKRSSTVRSAINVCGCCRWPRPTGAPISAETVTHPGPTRRGDISKRLKTRSRRVRKAIKSRSRNSLAPIRPATRRWPGRS